MPLDMTGMTLTADERSSEAKRIIDRIRKPLEDSAFRWESERAWGFLQSLFRQIDLFPDEPVVLSPKQLLWLRDIGQAVD